MEHGGGGEVVNARGCGPLIRGFNSHPSPFIFNQTLAPTIEVNMEFNELIKNAKARTKEMDATDRESGFAADSDTPGWMRLRTVMFALEAGLKTEDWDCVAEAYVTLEEVNKTIETKIKAENN